MSTSVIQWNCVVTGKNPQANLILLHLIYYNIIKLHYDPNNASSRNFFQFTLLVVYIHVNPVSFKLIKE